MAKTYEYLAIVAGDFLCEGRSLTYKTAVVVVRRGLAPRDEGTTGKIKRRLVSRSRVSATELRGPWLPHRAYVVNAQGAVERTDR